MPNRRITGGLGRLPCYSAVVATVGVPEYVAPVKVWSAYVLAVLTPVQIVLLVGLFIMFLRTGPLADSFSVVVFVVFVIAALTEASALTWATVRASRMVRYPPRLSPHGIRMWLYATSEYVFIPWGRVRAMRDSTISVSRGLYVFIDDAEGLAAGDRSKARKIRRAMRRYHGTPFAYALTSSPARLRGLDEAIRGFTAGHLALQRSG